MFLWHHGNVQSKLFTIGTVSGIKLGKGDCVHLNWGEGVPNEETKNAIFESQGFHTGNYYHMLLGGSFM
jgi:hypothetical protein